MSITSRRGTALVRPSRTISFDASIQSITTEDGGQARIVEIHPLSSESTVFIRLQSWDETGEHAELKALELKVAQGARVTIDFRK